MNQKLRLRNVSIIAKILINAYIFFLIRFASSLRPRESVPYLIVKINILRSVNTGA